MDAGGRLHQVGKQEAIPIYQERGRQLGSAAAMAAAESFGIIDMSVESYIAEYADMPTNWLRQPAPEAKAFFDWLTTFNRLVGQRWPGATLLDLAERPYEDWFHQDNWTPEQAVCEVVRDQGPELDQQFPRCR